MDEISFMETSSVVDETDISMNVSIGGNEGGPDENIYQPDSPVAENIDKCTTIEKLKVKE